MLAPVVDEAGLFLEDVSISGSGKQLVVRVSVDAPEEQTGSVTLDQIADASRAVSQALDAVSSLRDAYTLEVSSPGTNRALTMPRHFRRSVGRLIKVVRTDKTDFVARLKSVSEDTLTFEDEGEVALTDIRKAKVEVELKRAEELKESDFVDIEEDDADGREN